MLRALGRNAVCFLPRGFIVFIAQVSGLYHSRISFILRNGPIETVIVCSAKGVLLCLFIGVGVEPNLSLHRGLFDEFYHESLFHLDLTSICGDGQSYYVGGSTPIYLSE